MKVYIKFFVKWIRCCSILFSRCYCVCVKYFNFLLVFRAVQLVSVAAIWNTSIHITNEHQIESLCFIIDIVADRKGRNNVSISRVFLDICRRCFYQFFAFFSLTLLKIFTHFVISFDTLAIFNRNPQSRHFAYFVFVIIIIGELRSHTKWWKLIINRTAGRRCCKWEKCTRQFLVRV